MQVVGESTNYRAALSGKGWFTLFRLYRPKKAFFDKSWIPEDVKKLN